MNTLTSPRTGALRRDTALQRSTCALVIGLLGAPVAWAQAGPPVNAGVLLEQQRRETPTAPPQAPAAGVLPATPARPTLDTTVANPGMSQTTVRRFDVAGHTLLAEADVQAALAPWLNRVAGLPELRQAASSLEDAYRARGWLARVTLPAQDITDGMVRMTVTESRLGRVRVQQGTPPLRADLSARVQAMLEHQLPAGQALSLQALERALLLADDLPGVRVQGSLQAGDSPGTTEVMVTLSPGPALRGEASVDNGGNRATGAERINAHVHLLSPLGLGEQFSLSTSLSRGAQYLGLHASAPLPGTPGLQGWRMVAHANLLRYAVRSARNTTTGLAPEGDSNALGLGVQYPLVRTALAHWVFSAGLGQTRLHNRDDNVLLNQRDTTSRGRARSLQLGVAGHQFDRWAGGGVTSASLALTHGRLSLDGSPASFVAADAQSAATEGNYTKLRWSATRLQSLAPRTTLVVAALGQFAGDNLDASEKLYLGGMHGVRAYPNGEAGGSTGTQLTLELRQNIAPQWEASAFYDWGQVHQYQRNRYAGNTLPLVLRNRVTLQGAGLALAWNVTHSVELKASWAHRIGNNPLATASGADTDGSLHANRLWLEASIGF